MTRVATDVGNWGPEAESLAARIRAQRGGRLPNLYRVLMHSPPIAAGWLELLTAIRQRSTLAARYRELAILRVALLTRADYEYRAHVPFALAAGVHEIAIDALPDWRSSPHFDAATRAVLELSDRMTDEVQVSDEHFSRVREHFGECETVELCVTIAAYNMVSRVLAALDVSHDAPAGSNSRSPS